MKRAKTKTGINPRRRNGAAEDAAGRLSESFHGRPAHEIRDYEGARLERTLLADLGRLVSLTVKTPEGEQYVLRPLGARVSCDPEGRQLYLVGGDQSADGAKLAARLHGRDNKAAVEQYRNGARASSDVDGQDNKVVSRQN